VPLTLPWVVALAALLIVPALAGCKASPLRDVPLWGTERPARRTSGARVPPPFGGADPVALGFTRVEGLWLTREEAVRWQPGGAGVLPLGASPPGEGLTLRTDHVLLRTDLTADRALPLVRAAQDEVLGLMAAYGEVLDLRLPAAPLPVTVYARRADFEVALAASVPEPTGWNAFYDVVSGTVRVSAEPAAHAPLPVLADLRHELAHALVDLSAPADPPHLAIVGGLHFWLWEGFAVHAESHPDGGTWPAQPEVATRLERFRARWAHGGPTPLAEFFRLDQSRFEGRHYDQAALVMEFLLSDYHLRPRTLDLLRRLIRGDVLRNDIERELLRSPDNLDRVWRAWLLSFHELR
jgi:hypothetical protein